LDDSIEAMLRAFVLFIAGISASCLAQETLSVSDLSRADLVVVGTLRQDFKFPWIDGWNERGHIEVERALKGSTQQTKLPFAWERDFKQGWCMTRPDGRGTVGERGIWVLTRAGSRYRATSLFGGFLDLRSLGEITKLLAEEGLASRVVH
jgi:hypothetical protein